jgi:hypothetical protein
MGFLTGRATFQRLRTPGSLAAPFGEDHIELLRQCAAGNQRVAAADGTEAGWAAGDHELDTTFTLEKNVVSECLAFDLRIDTNKLPGGLLRSYYQIELTALSKDNPSGKPSAKQKREAKEYAKERLEQEAKDGRYKRRKTIPVLWDGDTVYFGAIGAAHLDRFTMLFKETFGIELTAVTAGSTADARETVPSGFVPGAADGVAWVPEGMAPDYLGNEFLMWLWYMSDGDGDTIKLADGTEATFMLARTLTLECPRGQTGHETITSDGPTRLPEAKRGVQAGKLPRKAGMTLVRHDHQYELTLHAETLSVGGLKFPAPDESETRAKLDERVAALRHLTETLDGLYAAFLDIRLSGKWADTLSRVQRWLSREERMAA